MKIKKFENISNSTKWTHDKIVELDQFRREVENKEDDLKYYLKNYLELNRHLIREDYDNDCEIGISTWYFNKVNPRYKFTIDYYDEEAGYPDEPDNCDLTEEQYNYLLEYLQNPNLYKNVKKYNL